MNYTLFLSPNQAAWRLDVDDPLDGEFVGQFLDDVQENVLWRRVESIAVDEGDTRSITFAITSLEAEWIYVIAKVVGWARINLTGKDTDGSTSITSALPSYGNTVLPGFLIFSSYNLDTVQVEGLADGTSVELFAAVACADNDTRLITNE